LKKYKDKGTILKRNKKMTGRQLCYEYCRNGFADCQTGTSFRDQEVFDLVNEMKDAISLSIGEPDFVTPWNIRRPVFIRWKKGIPTIRQMRDLWSCVKRYASIRRENTI